MRRRPAGWLPPGPIPPGAQGAPDLEPGPDETLDSLAGHWRIFQLRHGHRYSTDDLLTAWYAVSHWRSRAAEPVTLLDLGCGVGSVMLLALWAFPNARAVGIEAQSVSAALARRSARYNGLQERTRVVHADFRDPGALDADERFDLVTGSPPYLVPTEGRRSERPQRGPCRFEDRGGVGEYLRVAEAHLAPAGLAAWVHATRYASEVLEAADRCGLRRVRWRKVQFREGGDSLISLFSAERSGEWLSREEEPLVVRRRDRGWSEEYRAVREEMGFPV